MLLAASDYRCWTCSGRPSSSSAGSSGSGCSSGSTPTCSGARTSAADEDRRVIFTLVLPIIGVLVYLVSQGVDAGPRPRGHADQRSATDDYIRSVGDDAGRDAAGEGRGPAGRGAITPTSSTAWSAARPARPGGRTVRSCPGRRTGGRVRVADERDGEHAALTVRPRPSPRDPGRGPSGVSSRVRAAGEQQGRHPADECERPHDDDRCRVRPVAGRRRR